MIYFEIIENINSETVYYTVRRSFGFFEYIIKWPFGVKRWIGPAPGDSLWIYEIYARRFSSFEDAIKSANYHANIAIDRTIQSNTKKKVIQKIVFGVPMIENCIYKNE